MEQTIAKKRVLLFALVAYALPYALGILMWYGAGKGMNLSMFPNAQMMYPAAGVMLGILLTGKGDDRIPKRFFIFFLILTGIMALMCVGSIFMQSIPWDMATSIPIMIGSILGWIFLFTEKKEKWEAYGLRGKNAKSSVFCVLLFVLLYFLRAAIGFGLDGNLSGLLGILSYPLTWINLAALPVNFFLVFIAFFGEEYGWRYYLTPLLQKKYGKRIGVIILGILWGLWHLPVDFFYYTTETGLQMAVAQQITCITLGIFFAYTYMKTQNIWVPVILHMLNNNLVPILSQNYSADVLENQVVRWGDLLPALIINGILFGGFLLAKEYRKDRKEQEVR